MVYSAIKLQAGLATVSRDADYGITIENKSYINDHLRHEFSDRVSRKRKLILYSSLSEALKAFDVPVSKQEEQVEKELLAHPIYGGVDPASGWLRLRRVRQDSGSGWTEGQRAYLSTVGDAEGFSTGILELLRHAGVEPSKTEPGENEEFISRFKPAWAGPLTFFITNVRAMRHRLPTRHARQ
jgi:hypothetical protein